MKDKTAEILARALEDVLKENQMSAREIMQALIGAPLSPRQRKFVSIMFKGEIKQTFMNCPEPSKEKLSEALAMLNAIKGSRHKVRKLLMSLAKNLPSAPGGPRRKINQDEERAVCAEIIALRAQCDNREAIRHVAYKRGVSERTVYRVWGKYYPKKKKLKGSSKL